MRIPCVIAIAVLVAIAAPGSAGQSDGTRLGSGRVVTGTAPDVRPVRRAKVTLTAEASGRSVTTDTDSDGRYRYVGLDPGTYTLQVEKPGYVTLRVRAAPDGTVAMARGSAIEGRVTDANGDPLWGVVVAAVRATTEGEPSEIVAQSRTDDLGRYRVHSLGEGDYVVRVATDQRFLQRQLLLPVEKPQGVDRVDVPPTLQATALLSFT